MEITLEKIELVKDRTGVSYKEAKEALEGADGSVIDAIIAIEETIDTKTSCKLGEQGTQIMNKIKETVKKGNVSKLVIKTKEDDVLLNLPLNIGIIGGILAPWATVAGIIASFGTKCKIELVKDNGDIVQISDMAIDTFQDVKEKSAVFAEEVKVKGTDVYESVRAKAEDTLGKYKKYGDENCCCCEDDDDEAEGCDCCCQEEKADEKEEDSNDCGCGCGCGCKDE